MIQYYNPILRVFEPEKKTPYLKKDFKGWNEMRKMVK